MPTNIRQTAYLFGFIQQPREILIVIISDCPLPGSPDHSIPSCFPEGAISDIARQLNR